MFNNKILLGQIIALVVVCFLISLVILNTNLPEQVKDLTVAKILPGSAEPVTISAEQTLNIEPVVILLVPGHDSFSKGGFFRELYEEEITLELAKYLADNLQADKRFKVVTTRDFTTGDYTDEFLTYFTNAETQIESFKQQAKQTMKSLLATGTVDEVEPIIQHNEVGKTTGFRLYGINKWANDHKVDLALHIHFNDHPREFHDNVGKYTGFAMYVPEQQFTNASSSRQVAEKLLTSLSVVSATSTFPSEAGTIIESQDLIATGANNSQTHPAVLVEYGYIYEPQYYLAGKRAKSLPLLAEQTHQGLIKYFFGK